MTPDPRPGGRIDIDRDAVRRDLMKLVLTIVELLRQLMERQALRRVEQIVDMFSVVPGDLRAECLAEQTCSKRVTLIQ